MLETAAEFVLPLIAAKAAPFILTGGAIMTSALSPYTSIDPPRTPSYVQRIGNYTAMYSLTAGETDQLRSVLTDYPAEDVERELAEELRCIMAARRLATMPEMTNETVDRARRAFESGAVPFVRQDVD